MMKVLIVSDIHGNLEGLKTVFEEAGDVDEILCAGDITGYYPFVNEVVDLLKKNNVVSVLGNHDQYLLDGKAPKNTNQKVKESIEFTKKIISKESLNFLKTLPEKIEIKIGGKKVFMCHGSPWDLLEERIYPDYANFEKFNEADSDVIVLGHTHYPYIRKIRNKTIINPGSCGQPRDHNLLSYIIWDNEGNTFENIRLDWDIAKFKKEAIKAGTNPELFDVFNEKS